jgi:hypothetical protein
MAQRNLQDYLSDLQRIDRTLPCWGVLCQQRPTAWNVIGAGILNDALAAAGIKRALTVPILQMMKREAAYLWICLLRYRWSLPMSRSCTRLVALSVGRGKCALVRPNGASPARERGALPSEPRFCLDVRPRPPAQPNRTSAVNTISKADNCVLHLLDEKTGELQAMA